MAYKRPGIAEMSSKSAFREAVIRQQSGGTKVGARTTLSMTGDRQMNVTAHSLSDIMQGSLAVRGGQDPLLIINKALSQDLDFLYKSDYSTISAFSSAQYEDIGGLSDGDETGGIGGDLGSPGSPGSYEGSLPGEEIAQIGYQVGMPENGPVPLWKMVAVSGRESKWNPAAINKNTSDRGLWQINMHAHGNALAEEGILQGGPFANKRDGYEIWEPQLLDPIINAKAAYQIIYGRGGDPAGNFAHAWGADPNTGRWVGRTGDPLHKTDPAKAKQAVADAKAKGLLGKPWTNYQVPPSGGGGAAGGIGGSSVGTLQNTKAELIRAGTKLANHPNNRLVSNGGSASAFRKFLTQGAKNFKFDRYGNGMPPGEPDSYSVILIDGLTYMLPSLMNYLWYILESGFILDQCWGSLGVKYTSANVNKRRVSNHSGGGAVDIGAIGLASEGRTYGINANNSDSRRVCDKLWNLLASRPKSEWASEHGCDWAQNYGNQGFHTYFDSGHIHLSFSNDRVGVLDKKLLS